MTITNIKFAVVREDPLIEQSIIERISPKNVLMVASGGCTALSLKSLFPNVNFILFDSNPNQIQLVKNKIKALENYNNDSNNNAFKEQFNIGFCNPEGLNNSGEFESLFRCFREFLTAFILSKQNINDIFVGPKTLSKKILMDLLNNKYWPVAFDLFFSNELLLAIFGPDAIQHAKPNSYPRYFQKIFENGFHKADFTKNYFLHHVFLGYYLSSTNSMPYYFQNRANSIELEYINGQLLEIENISKFELISLSNIFDWMPENAVLNHLKYLENNLLPRSFIIFRQLNNSKDYSNKIRGFKSHTQLARDLLAKDRSLFYNKINILEKI